MNAPNPEFDVRTVKHRSQPLIRTSTVERLLLRHVNYICPESRLCVNVIKQAFVDLCGPSRDARRNARRFFHNGQLQGWCDLVDLNPEFVMEIAVKTGYLPVSKMGGQRA